MFTNSNPSMVPDAEKKQAEREHLNEVSGPVSLPACTLVSFCNLEHRTLNVELCYGFVRYNTKIQKDREGVRDADRVY